MLLKSFVDSNIIVNPWKSTCLLFIIFVNGWELQTLSKSNLDFDPSDKQLSLR